MDFQILRYLQSPLSLNQLKQIHALVTVNCSSLTSIFTRKLLSLSFTNYARKVFDDIPQPDPRLCNTFSACYSKLSLNRQALDMFAMMHRRWLKIDSYTISPVMKPCSALIVVEWNLVVQTAPMDFYAKSGDLDSAKAIFDFISVKNALGYNILILGYLKCGDFVTVRKLFDEMTEGTTLSWILIISCYAHSGDLDEAMKMFERM